jgi:hypothetical protein
MEPVFLILGQSSAIAAALAADSGKPVQEVPYSALKELLQVRGQVLDLPRTPAKGRPARSYSGVVVDDDDAQRQGAWQESSAIGPYVGRGYRHDGDADHGAKSASFRARLSAGRYEVSVAYTPYPNRAQRVPVTIRHARGSDLVTLDQQRNHGGNAPFAVVGTFEFDGPAEVEVSNRGTTGHVVIDAVRFVRVER